VSHFQHRQYQHDYVETLSENWKRYRRQILVGPTGMGKGAVCGMMAKRAHDRGKKMLVMADRRQLIQQLAKTMMEFGVPWNVEMAQLPDSSVKGNEWVRRDPSANITIASRDTLLSRCIRNPWQGLPRSDVCVIDECHLWDKGRGKELADAVGAPFLLGMTATPCYGNGQGLGKDNWDVLVEKVTTKWLVENGYLVRMKYFEPPETKHARKSGKKTGVVGDMLEMWRMHAEWKRTVAFFSRLSEATMWRDKFRKTFGIGAEVIDGKMPHSERQNIIDRIKAGEVLWCGSVGTLTTGVDVPEWEVVQLGIKCDSIVKYRQIGGRVMRTCDSIDKKYAIFLDHSGAVEHHGLLDEEIQWQLEESGGIEKRLKKEREEGKRASPVSCHKCGCLFVGLPVCPECKTPTQRWEKKSEQELGREVLVERGETQESYGQIELRKKRQQKEWTSFLYQCKRLGRTVKVANSMFFSKFKVWPEQAGVTPVFDRMDRETPMTEMDVRTGRRKEN
jgi:DNA repair protein RadD